MSRGKELIKNTGILMIAKISTQVVNFLLIPLYTSLLTTEEYGVIDIYTSLAMIIVPFLTLQVEMGLFRYFILSKEENDKTEIISSSYFIVIVIQFIISIIYWITAIIIHLESKELLYGYYISQALYVVLLQTCRAKGSNFDYGLASFICSALTVVLNVLFIRVFHMKVEGILISAIIAQLVSSIYMIIRTKLLNYMKLVGIKVRKIKELITYSVPLVINQIASWTINYSDHLIIFNVWGKGDNGIYSIATKFSNILNTFFGVYNVAWTESVVRSMDDKDDNKYISQVFELTFNIYILLIIGILTILPFCFDILVKGEFKEAYQQIPFLLIAMLFSGMAATLGSIYIAYNKTKEVSATTVLASICNIIVHFILLRKFKLYAASISTLVSFVMLYVYRTIALKKFFELKYNKKRIYCNLLIALFAWGAYALKNKILIISCFMINIFLLWILFKNNKDTIKALIRNKKTKKVGF